MFSVRPGQAVAEREVLMGRLDPSTAEIIGPGFFEDTALKDALTELPTEFNVPETIDAVEQTEVSSTRRRLTILAYCCVHSTAYTLH